MMNLENQTRTRKLVLASLFTALTVVLSQISIPIGVVPINLATFSVFASGLLLGSKLGALSQIAYVLLGAAGLPVFAGFRGGVGIVAGPTGGYIVSYIVAAFVVGLVMERTSFSVKNIVAAVLAGWVVNLAMGTAWYMLSMKVPLVPALAVCVLPFIIGDVLKIILVTAVSYRLIPILTGGKVARG